MSDVKTKTESCVFRFIFLAVVIGIAAFAFRDSYGDIIKELIRTPLNIVIIALLLVLGYFTIEGLIITTLAKKYVPSFTFRDGIHCAYYCGFFKIVTLGGGSGIAEVYYLYRKGISTGTGTGMSLVQYTMQKVAITLFGLTSLIIFNRRIMQIISGYGIYVLLGSLLVVAIVSFFVFIGMSKKLSNLIIALLRKIPISKPSVRSKIDKLAYNIDIFQQETAELIREKKKLILIVIYNILKLVFWYLIPCIVCMNGDNIDIGFYLALASVVFMLAGAVPLPAGYGSVDVIFVVIFMRVVGVTRATSAMVIFRFATILIPLVLGGICYYTLRGRKETKPNE